MDRATKVQNLDEAGCISLFGKVCIQGFFLHVRSDIRTDWAIKSFYGNQFKRRKKTEFKTVKLHLKNDLVSHPALGGGGGRTNLYNTVV